MWKIRSIKVLLLLYKSKANYRNNIGLGPGKGGGRVVVISSDLVLPSVLDEWTKQGGEDWQLLEPVDGFHSNQVDIH